MLAAAPVATAVSSRITAEWIRNDVAVQELQPEWDELLQSSRSDCLFLTFEWLSTWWKHLAEDRKLAILALRAGGELAALAPCCIRESDWKQGRPLPVLEFLGSGFVGSDYLDFIIREGLEERTTNALAAGLATQRAVQRWTQLGRPAAAENIAAALSERGWSVVEAITNVCPYIPLEGTTWESYLGSLGSEHRYNFNRKSKRIHRDFTVTFDQVRSGSECGECIDQLIAQHNSRWNGRGGSDAFHLPELIAFHQEFSQLALRRGWLRLYVLRLNGAPAAFLYGFLYQRKFYFYQSSFDAAYEKYSVGLIAMGLAIRSAIEEGADEYDLLHGDERYKSHWCLDRRDLGRLELYPPGLTGHVLRSGIGMVRASRRLAQRVIPARPLA